MSSNNQTNNCFVLLRNNYRHFFNYEHFYIQGLVYNSRALQLIGQGLQEQKNRGKGINVARSFLQGSAFFFLSYELHSFTAKQLCYYTDFSAGFPV